MLPDYERLGVFYLGRDNDRQPVLYDSRDLTTHAVAVGMTGSGKTGLCIGLLEEAALDGIPAIAIDVKGDLGNLLFTFPDLAPGDFEPWVDHADAARRNVSVPERAAQIASKWRAGLADWDQGPDRIQRMRDAVDLAIYTPGSEAGRPLDVLGSLSPPESVDPDDLLTLLGIDADPLQSREFILLSAIIGEAWDGGETLDLSTLIRSVQDPPLDRIGVLPLDDFYPRRDRTKLAMALNNLLASPGFAAWSTGERLDIQRLLWTDEGKPRISILSIAHLDDRERMFFVATLLGRVLEWMRRQPGSGSLRALLYMDEVAGYLPPTAMPPSKPPMLTLLKQARAFGLGVCLATQNPVDLDYKALSNMGTWFLGRLQTERDKLRVLDGLEGVGMDRAELDSLLSGLEPREFLLHNVHSEAPTVLHTRWVLSWLRGPLTRDEVRRLCPPIVPASSAAPAPSAAPPTPGEASAPAREQVVVGHGASYHPALLVTATLVYRDARRNIDHTTEMQVLWDGQDAEPLGDRTAIAGKPPGKQIAPPQLDVAGALTWLKAQDLILFRSAAYRLRSNAGEPEGDFRIRVALAARHKRDKQVADLHTTWARKLQRMAARIEKGRAKVETQQQQLGDRKTDTAISMGGSMLGAIFGRRWVSATNARRATGAMRGARRMRGATSPASWRSIGSWRPLSRRSWPASVSTSTHEPWRSRPCASRRASERSRSRRPCSPG
jgi:hypothetical protein